MTALVGILNITPDSFSDGGAFLARDKALAHAEELLGTGAAVIDVGAESTRPGATPIEHAEEWARLEPVLSSLIERVHANGGLVSVDTRHAKTAHKAIELGADWINDVSGGENPCMRKVIAESKEAGKSRGPVKFVVMHHLGVPADSARTIPENADPVEVVADFFRERLALLEAEGISRARIILDPGVGFGKTAQQSLEVIRHIARFRSFGCPLFVGHSRKSFLSHFKGTRSLDKAPDRDLETLAASLYMESQGVEYLRVHNVEAHRRMLAVSRTLAR